MSIATRLLASALCLAPAAAAQQPRTGLLALLREDVDEALALSTAQRRTIRELADEARRKVRALAERARSGEGDRGELRARATELREEALRAALALLDEEQRRQWAKLAASAPRGGARRKRRSPFDRPPRALGPDDLVRLRARPRGPEPAEGLWVYATELHAVAPSGYLVLSDHEDPIALRALDALAKERGGSVLRVADLAALARDAEARDALRNRVRRLMPRYVAVAPRLSSYHENTVLAMWEVFSSLDEDPQLDVFPGFLVASTPKSLAALVERTLAWRPVAKRRAFTVSEIPSDLLYKAYEAAGIVRELLARSGVPAQDLTIPASAEIAARPDYPSIVGPGRFELRKKTKRELLRAFPGQVGAAIEAADFLWVLGHGRPGMACAATVPAYTRLELANKIVFCGACFAASAPKSDLFLPPRRGAVEQPRFALRAIDDGAVLVLGGMGLSQGLHFMLPMLEGCLEGMSAGEAFQRVLNTQLGEGGFDGPYVDEPARGRPRNMPPAARRANALVTVLIGDPALRIFPERRRL